MNCVSEKQREGAIGSISQRDSESCAPRSYSALSDDALNKQHDELTSGTLILCAQLAAHWSQRRARRFA
jgi:hypothetical protein